MTTTTAPTNEQSIAIQQLADMVAAAAAFQDQCQVYSNEEAAAFVHYPHYAVESQQIDRPFAVIYPKSYTPRRLADGIVMPSGELFLQLGLTMADDNEAEGEERRFDNWQGDIIKHVHDTDANAAGFRMLCTQSTPPTRSHPAHVAALGAQFPFWFVEYTVNWDPFG